MEPNEVVLFRAYDGPGPNPGLPLVEAIYSQVLAQTASEGFARNGLYRARLESVPSVQTEALLLPPGIDWLPTEVAPPGDGL